MKMIIDEWLGVFEANENGSILQLVNTILWCGTVKRDLSLRELECEDPSVALSEFQDSLDQSVLGANQLVGKKRPNVQFQRSFVEFWSRWTQSVFSNLEDASSRLEAHFFPWLILLTSSQFRPLRQAASLAAFSVLVGLSKASADLSNQLEKAQKITKMSTKTSSLIDTLTLQISACEGKMQSLFSSVFVQRFRDVDKDIRRWSLEQLVCFIQASTNLFLDNMYLRYLGWGLSDKVPEIRLAAIECLDDLYRDAKNVPTMVTFTERFKPRIMEMAQRDIDEAVRKEAQSLLLRLFSADQVSLEELGFVDRIVSSRGPLSKEGAALVFARCFGSAKNTSAERLMESLLAYIRNRENLSLLERLLTSEYLVAQLAPSAEFLADPVKCQADLMVFAAACRHYVYPATKGRVTPARPSGLERSLHLTSLVGDLVVAKLKADLSDDELLALCETIPLLDPPSMANIEDLVDNLHVAFSRSATTDQHVVIAAVKAFRFLIACEKVRSIVETQLTSLLQHCLADLTESNTAKAALLLSIVRLPEATDLSALLERCQVAYSPMLLQLLYQELLWRMTVQKVSEAPSYDAVIPLRDEIEQLCCNDLTSSLILLDLFHLFGPQQEWMSETWRYQPDANIKVHFDAFSEIIASALEDNQSEIISKIVLGLARIATDGYQQAGDILVFISKFYGLLPDAPLVMSSIELIKSNVEPSMLADSLPEASIAQYEMMLKAQMEDLSACLELTKTFVSYLKHHQLSNVRSSECFVAWLESNESGREGMASIAALYIPLLPPTSELDLSALKQLTGKKSPQLTNYVKAAEKHLSKTARNRKLQLTPQKRRSRSTTGASRLKEMVVESDADVTDQEEEESPFLNDENLASETNAFQQMALENEAQKQEEFVPLRKKRVLNA